MKSILSSALLVAGLAFSSGEALGSSLENSLAKDTTRNKINLKPDIPELNYRHSKVVGSSLADVNMNGKVDGKFIIYKTEGVEENIVSAYYALKNQEGEELHFSENPIFIIEKLEDSYDAYINKNENGKLYDKTSYEEFSKWLQNYNPCFEVE